MIHQGENSGYQAINLAYNMGAETIVLIGYDMGFLDKRHFFGEHPQPLGQSSDYPRLCRNFATIKPDDYNIDIINCARTTRLDCFRRGDLEETLRSSARHRPKPKRPARVNTKAA